MGFHLYLLLGFGFATEGFALGGSLRGGYVILVFIVPGNSFGFGLGLGLVKEVGLGLRVGNRLRLSIVLYGLIRIGLKVRTGLGCMMLAG